MTALLRGTDLHREGLLFRSAPQSPLGKLCPLGRRGKLPGETYTAASERDEGDRAREGNAGELLLLPEVRKEGNYREGQVGCEDKSVIREDKGNVEVAPVDSPDKYTWLHSFSGM